MEILVEILLRILGWAFQFLGELLLQLILEGVASLFGHAVKAPFQRPRPIRPWLAATGYAILGAAAGGFSVWLFPGLFIQAQWLRIANLLLTPVLAGLVMEAIGSWRERREKDVLRLESFAYGFCFAFAMALVRYAFA